MGRRTSTGLWARPDSPYWWIVLPRPGGRDAHGKPLPPYRESSKIPQKGPTPEITEEYRRLAALKYARRLSQQARGELGLEKAAPETTPTLRTFVNGDPAQPVASPRRRGYRTWLTAERPHSAAETLRRLDALFLPTLGDLPIADIRPAQIESWRALRRAAKVTDQTMDRDLSDLRGLLSKAVEWDAIARHPLAELNLPVSPSQEIVRYLTTEEAPRLSAALKARDEEMKAARARFNTWRLARQKTPLPEYGTYPDALTPLVMTALYTGIRRGELFRLTWRAIDWQSHTLTIRAERGRKNKKTRRIPINAILLPILRTWRGQHPKTTFVFPGRTGAPLTNVQSSWENVLKAAAIEDFRWHDLRHTFASWLVMKGVSLYRVSMFLGHSTETTTRRYAHLAPDQDREAVELLASL